MGDCAVFDRLVCPTFDLFTQDLPVNIKVIIEGMEEAGSVALEELVKREKDRFFSSVDYIVISDNLWLSQRRPALIYGTRGNSYFTVEVSAKPGGLLGGSHPGVWEGQRQSCVRAQSSPRMLACLWEVLGRGVGFMKPPL